MASASFNTAAKPCWEGGREGGSDGREIKVISFGIYFQIKQAVVVDTADAGSVKIATPIAACRIYSRTCDFVTHKKNSQELLV